MFLHTSCYPCHQSHILHLLTLLPLATLGRGMLHHDKDWVRLPGPLFGPPPAPPSAAVAAASLPSSPAQPCPTAQPSCQTDLGLHAWGCPTFCEPESQCRSHLVGRTYGVNALWRSICWHLVVTQDAGNTRTPLTLTRPCGRALLPHPPRCSPKSPLPEILSSSIIICSEPSFHRDKCAGAFCCNSHVRRACTCFQCWGMGAESALTAAGRQALCLSQRRCR
jgi:hypothetical protein